MPLALSPSLLCPKRALCPAQRPWEQRPNPLPWRDVGSLPLPQALHPSAMGNRGLKGLLPPLPLSLPRGPGAPATATPAAAPSGSSWQPGTSWVRAGERGLGSGLPQRSHTDPTQMVSRTCIPVFPRWGARCPLLAGLAHPSQQGPSLTQGSAPTPGASLAQGMSLARVVSLAQGAFLAQGTHLCCSTPQTCSALGSAGSVSQLR